MSQIKTIRRRRRRERRRRSQREREEKRRTQKYTKMKFIGKNVFPVDVYHESQFTTSAKRLFTNEKIQLPFMYLAPIFKSHVHCTYYNAQRNVHIYETERKLHTHKPFDHHESRTQQQKKKKRKEEEERKKHEPKPNRHTKYVIYFYILASCSLRPLPPCAPTFFPCRRKYFQVERRPAERQHTHTGTSTDTKAPLKRKLM